MTLSAGSAILAADVNAVFGDHITPMAASGAVGRRAHYIMAQGFAIDSTTVAHKRSTLFRPNDDMEIQALHIIDWGHASATTRDTKAALYVNDGDTKYLLDDDMSVTNTDATTGQTSSVLDVTAKDAAKKNWVLKGVLYRLEVEVVTTSFTHSHLQAILALTARQRR